MTLSIDGRKRLARNRCKGDFVEEKLIFEYSSRDVLVATERIVVGGKTIPASTAECDDGDWLRHALADRGMHPIEIEKENPDTP